MQVVPRDKSLTKKKYSFCQEIKVQQKRDTCFIKRENFHQKDIKILPREKKLAKKIYWFCQKIKV